MPFRCITTAAFDGNIQRNRASLVEKIPKNEKKGIHKKRLGENQKGEKMGDTKVRNKGEESAA